MENKSKYWIKKWQAKRWKNFEELKLGDTFDTSVQNHRQFANSIGDKILWYRTDKNKEGIYFATEVVAEPKRDDAYNNGYSMSIRVIKTLNEKYKVIPEENGFSDLMNRQHLSQKAS